MTSSTVQGNEGLEYRRRYGGLIGVHSKVPIRDRAILSLIYTPGVAEACLAISQDALASFDLTCRGNTVALLTDGSDIFGREEGPAEAALPIAEGKSVIFKTFAGIDAFPVCVNSRDPYELIRIGMGIAPTFGAICIDDMSAPRSFTVADHLEKACDIPVFNNQHHGTAALVLGGLYNALKVTGRDLATANIVVSGAGVAGVGVARLLKRAGGNNIVVCDRAGAIHTYRSERMNWAKAYVASETNRDHRQGSLEEMLRGADVFIGLSTGNIVTPEMIRSMADDPIVFALAVPEPEISPALAREAGARVIATGRSDYPNTMDVSLVFPGVFRGLLDSRARNIRLRTLLAASRALADMVPDDELHADRIVPSIFDFRVAPAIAAAVVRATIDAGEAQRKVLPEDVAERTRRFVYEGRFQPVSQPVRGEQKTFREEAIELRRRHGGVLEIESKLPIRDQHILNMVYVPPAALVPAHVIRDDPSQVMELTSKGNLVAIVTDGSAVLGLGDIGPQAALPVMEGKAVLFRSLAGVEAFPICLAARDPDEIVEIVAAISPSFGGINLEDISAPRCFEIERKLRARLDMP
ncbi:MAG TPA: malic enzyme-like NAD(P)-binding protein, partial [Thermomicrobiales bacterium]|nr:malic enzyme-like NAD(P)-binding protein [Thermomicrobiales bacterium]